MLTPATIVACGLLAFLAPLQSAFSETTVYRVGVDVEMVAVPFPHALELASQLSDPARFTGACARLQQMIADDEADLLGWPVVHFISPYEDSAASEAGTEIRYPTEFTPPRIPGDWISNSPIPPTALCIPYLGRFPLAPTAIETRLSGPTLKVQGTVSESGTEITLSFTASFVRLLGFQCTQVAKNPVQVDGQIEQPEFANLKSTAKVCLANGQRLLVGSFVIEKPEHRMVFFLLHAIATPAS